MTIAEMQFNNNIQDKLQFRVIKLQFLSLKRRLL